MEEKKIENKGICFDCNNNNFDYFWLLMLMIILFFPSNRDRYKEAYLQGKVDAYENILKEDGENER